MIDRHMVPAWVTNETSKGTQKRIWADLLKRLDSKGHNIDIRALTVNNGGKTT